MDTKQCFNRLTTLLKKYEIAIPNDYGFLDVSIPSLKVGSDIIELLPWRQDRRMIELKNMLHGGYAGVPCVYRVTRIVENTKELVYEIKRELDLCEWIIKSAVASIYMVKNGHVANLVVKLANDVVCTLEIATTLNKGEADINRHEINTRRGVLSDYVVDTQIPQESVYLFGEEKQKYTDTDFELYGLTYYEITAVRSAFAVLHDNLKEEYKQREVRLDELMEAAEKSNEQKCRISLLKQEI